jgi:hypothetical protein
VNNVTLRRTAAVVLVWTMFLAPAAWAGEVQHERPGGRFEGVFAALWVQVTALWDEAGAYSDLNGQAAWDLLTALWQEEGASIDPYGVHAVPPIPHPPDAGDRSEEGAYIDPNGAL